MTDLLSFLANLRRPRILMRAARFGLGDYRRERDLRRLVRSTPAPAQALPRLIDEEDRLETLRREGRADYSAARHIEVMIALMAEARLLPRGPQAV